MENRISDRFETRTDPGGRSWAPWSESTKATYPKDAHGSLLDRYGDLLDGRSHTVRGDWVLVGFDRDYAAWHEFGTKTMPRRGLLFDDPTPESLGAMTVSRSSSWSPTTSRPQRCSGPRACRACQLRRPLVAAPDA